MLCLVIKGPSYEEAKEQIERSLEWAELVELSLHHFCELDFARIKELQSLFAIPMLFTLRSSPPRLKELRQLASLNPDYLDLESDIPPEFVKEIRESYPNIRLILSHHNFSETPQDLEALYQKMIAIPADFYKIALRANSSLDSLRLLYFAKNLPTNVIAISMGPLGEWSRVVGRLLGFPITYASPSVGEETAPGQIPAKTLIEKYHYLTLNKNTFIYGLIGDPVHLSISDETHNHFIKTAKFDAVYIKIEVKIGEVEEFFHWLKLFPLFQGLSVTMPLKEAILPYLDIIEEKARAIGAVNTLHFKNGKVFGSNTDASGALNALEKKGLVYQKRLVLLGAGGAAKAIAYEASKRGAYVTIVNRDVAKGRDLARRIGGRSSDMLSCFEEGYDILINSTPLPMPIAPEYILPESIVMDIKTKPKEPPFLKYAKELGCTLVYGYEMFVEQAIGQLHIWLEASSYIPVIHEGGFDAIHRSCIRCQDTELPIVQEGTRIEVL